MTGTKRPYKSYAPEFKREAVRLIREVRRLWSAYIFLKLKSKLQRASTGQRDHFAYVEHAKVANNKTDLDLLQRQRQ